MKELEALSNQILQRIREEGQEKVRSKERQLAERLEEQRVRMVEHQKARKQAIQKNLDNQFERQAQSLANEKRNRLLAQKQQYLSAVYQEAVDRMTAWDTLTFQRFAEGVLEQFSGKEVRLVPGEKSQQHFSAAFVTALQHKHPNLSLASGAVSQKAGFIVEMGGVDYNFFFDEIVEEIKKDYSPKLASLAFQPDK